MKVSDFLMTTMLASCAITMGQDSIPAQKTDTLLVPKSIENNMVIDSVALKKTDSLSGGKTVKTPKVKKGEKRPTEIEAYFSCPGCGRG